MVCKASALQEEKEQVSEPHARLGRQGAGDESRVCHYAKPKPFIYTNEVTWMTVFKY